MGESTNQGLGFAQGTICLSQCWRFSPLLNPENRKKEREKSKHLSVPLFEHHALLLSMSLN